MAERLPQARWTQRCDLTRLIAALGAENMRWVGGAVRDTLLGAEVRDVDAATKLLPQTVIERCKAAGIRTVPTGIDHGTVTAILDDGPVEITTLRRDISTDGRRATIAFAEDWHEDAARRDFTINALYAHPQSLEIEDYFGGLNDLAAHRVRFIGDARARIREDHLRILRYYRFQARFGSQLDPEAEDACAELAETLKGISRERIAMELLALLSLPNPVPTIQRMYNREVLGVILPETGPSQLEVLAALPVHETAQDIFPEPIRRLAALLPADPSVAEAVAARLRLSKAQRERLSCIAARQDMDVQAPRALAYRKGLNCARDRLLVAGENITSLSDWEVPQFPLKGRQIISRGVSAGPQVARIMQQVETLWIQEEFPDIGRIDAILDAVLTETVSDDKA